MYLYHINFSFRLNCLILNDNGIESIELGNKVQGLFQFYTSLLLLCLLLIIITRNMCIAEPREARGEPIRGGRTGEK